MTNEDALTIFYDPWLATEQGLDEAEAVAIEALKKQIQIEETLGKGDMFYIIPQGNTWTVNGIDVQEALEKQIPKRPKITIHNGFCPNCENAFGKDWVVSAMDMPKWKSFCPVCGQAIDWSESND